MHVWYLEHRTVEPKKLTSDIVEHLKGRYNLGRTVIIADQPSVFLGIFRKHWLKEIGALRRARSSTLDAMKILKLSQEIAGMETLRFDSALVNEKSVNVRVVAPNQIYDLPTDCMTVYLGSCCQIDTDKITQYLPAKAMIVDYSKNLLAPSHLALSVS